MPAKHWFRRPKRSWRALYLQEQVGVVLAVLGLVGIFGIPVMVLVWNSLNLVRLAGGTMLPTQTVTAPAHFAMTALPISLGMMFVGWVVGSLASIRAIADLRRRRFRLCPGCAYDLSESPRVVKCPECARRFPARGVVGEWSRILPRKGRGWVSGDPVWIERHPERGA
jgi:hypothetical protein